MAVLSTSFLSHNDVFTTEGEDARAVIYFFFARALCSSKCHFLVLFLDANLYKKLGLRSLARSQSVRLTFHTFLTQEFKQIKIMSSLNHPPYVPNLYELQDRKTDFFPPFFVAFHREKVHTDDDRMFVFRFEASLTLLGFYG